MNFDGFHFAEPVWLSLALLAPLLMAALFHHAARQRRRQLARLASPHFLNELTRSHSSGRRRLKEILLLGAAAFAGLALARPQWGAVQTANAWVGEDMVFVMDCSLSMTTTDVSPSRMERAKFAVLDFVRRQSHGRVGLVAFAGTAFIQCPLTFDAGAFEESLLALDEKTIPVPGTDIGRALTEASQALDKNSKRKLMVLVTDGEDLEKSGVAVAKNLATNGVVIFTIGVGTATGKEIQTVSPSGQKDFLREPGGQIVHSRLDETTLREIAAATGGSYFPLGPLGDGLSKIRSSIHTLELASENQQARQNGVDRFYLPLGLVLLLLTAEPLIGTRRPLRRAAETQPAPTLKVVVLPLALLLALVPNSRADTETNGPATALEYYNAGAQLLAAKKFDEADSMFEMALKGQDDRVLPPALYNQGQARFYSGLDKLKRGPDAQRLANQGAAATAAGQQAIQKGQDALANGQISAMMMAYIQGRGARHDLREAQKAVSAAMETYGKTLDQWLHAAGDFESAAELNPSDTNATRNAQIVRQAIARLVDSLHQMQAMNGGMGRQREDLGKLLNKLKGQIPAPDAPPGQAGDDDDDDPGVKPDSLAGKQEGPNRDGQQLQIPLSPDQAGQILNGLSLDGTRRLDMSDKEGKPAPDRKGRNW
jgi:Ca-activated chloride channel family protein